MEMPYVVGVCAGHQAIAVLSGGRVEHMREKRAYLEFKLKVKGLKEPIRVCFHHSDHVTQLPPDFKCKKDRDKIIAEMWTIPESGKNHMGFQYHPERTEDGRKRLAQTIEGMIMEQRYQKVA
jgi:GMP synthase-like glutamine amidotransferase